MSEPPDNNAQEPPPRRPWYRLHRSTYVVAVLLLIVLVLIIVPGGWSFTDGGVEHGWPWRYLKVWGTTAILAQNWDYNPDEIWDGPPWLHKQGWLFKGLQSEFRLGALVGDVAVGLLILAIGVVIFEWWRRRRSRVWQFSLRELMIGILLLAAALGWWRQNHVRAQREVQALREPPSNPTIAEALLHQTGNSHWDYITVCRSPIWLHKLLGARLVADFYTVEVIVCLRGFRDDHSWDYFHRAKELPNLRRLGLVYSVVSDAGFETLAGLRQLTTLRMDDCSLDPEGSRRLTAMSNLRELVLINCTLDDATLESIGQLPRLRVLDLRSTKVSSTGLRHLAGLTTLRQLALSGSWITDSGFDHLESLTTLEELCLCGVKATPERLEQLRAALPNCRIETRALLKWYSPGGVGEITDIELSPELPGEPAQ